MRGEKEGTGGARERPQNDRRDAKGSTLDGGTAKATAADLQREKTPRNGRQGLDDWAVFPANCSAPKMSCLSTPPKIRLRGAGADLTKIQPAGIRTKSGGARSIEGGKGPAGSGLSLGVAGVENGGRKDATFLRPPW